MKENGHLFYKRCAACGGDKGKPFGARCYKCDAARDAERKRRRNAERPLAGIASAKLHAAIRAGTIKPVRGMMCADCGKKAECYDHRDYRKPLKVDPVCISCNKLRGPASPYKRLPQIKHGLPIYFGVSRERVRQIVNVK